MKTEKRHSTLWMSILIRQAIALRLITNKISRRSAIALRSLEKQEMKKSSQHVEAIGWTWVLPILSFKTNEEEFEIPILRNIDPSADRWNELKQQSDLAHELQLKITSSGSSVVVFLEKPKSSEKVWPSSMFYSSNFRFAFSDSYASMLLSYIL